MAKVVHVYVGGGKVKDASNQPFQRAGGKLTDALGELDLVVFKDRGSVKTYTDEEKERAMKAALLIKQAAALLK